MAFSMAPRRPIGAPDLAMASLRPALPRARIRASVASAYLPERASRRRFQACPLGGMAPSRGPVMAEIAVITCAVMSLIAGGTSVMDLIHCDEFIAQGRTSSRAPSCSATTSAASVDLSKPRLMISTNSIAPALLPPLHCCARVSVITAAACAGVCMVLLIVFSQCFPDSSVQNFRRNFAVVMGPCTSRYGPKVSRNLGVFFRNNGTKFGLVLNETYAPANTCYGCMYHSGRIFRQQQEQLSPYFDPIYTRTGGISQPPARQA